MRYCMALVLALTLSQVGCGEDTCTAACAGYLGSLQVSLNPNVSSTYDVDLVLDGARGAFTCEGSGLDYSDSGWAGPTKQIGIAQTVVECRGREFWINATPESVEISVTARDGSWTGSVKESLDYTEGGPRCPGGSELCPPFAEIGVQRQ